MSEFPEQIYRHATYRITKMWRERKGRYRLVGSRCKDCGQLWWPRRMGNVCSKCNSRNLEDYEFSHEGELIAHWENVGIFPLMGYAEYGSTRISAIVKLKEGVFVAPTEIIECPPDQIKDGMRVRMVVRKQKRESNGNWMYGYKWVPV